eukprot:856085-Prorocentrum_minimum.AAC.1
MEAHRGMASRAVATGVGGRLAAAAASTFPLVGSMRRDAAGMRSRYTTFSAGTVLKPVPEMVSMKPASTGARAGEREVTDVARDAAYVNCTAKTTHKK